MNSDEITSHALKIVIAILSWVAARYLPADVNATASAYIPTIAAGIVAAGAFGYAVYRHANMKLVPEKSTAIGTASAMPVGTTIPPTVAAAAKVVGALLIGFFVFGSAAIAQPKTTATAKPAATTAKLTTAQAISNQVALIQAFTVSDLQAALADAQAQTPPDTVSASCYSALIPVVQANIANPLPAALGGFQALQKARDLQNLISNLQSQNGPLAPLVTACAPLILSVQNVLVGLGLKAGLVSGVALSGGLALPIALPALPALGGL